MEKKTELSVEVSVRCADPAGKKYPANWEGLSFETLDAVQQLTGIMPLVLHGGSRTYDQESNVLEQVIRKQLPFASYKYPKQENLGKGLSF